MKSCEYSPSYICSLDGNPSLTGQKIVI